MGTGRTIALDRILAGLCPCCAVGQDECPTCVGLLTFRPSEETAVARLDRWQRFGKPVWWNGLVLGGAGHGGGDVEERGRQGP